MKVKDDDKNISKMLIEIFLQEKNQGTFCILWLKQ
jgi:hypothetical protein